jgi:hypothetical protein
VKSWCATLFTEKLKQAKEKGLHNVPNGVS